jgi:hypothetical protein
MSKDWMGKARRLACFLTLLVLPALLASGQHPPAVHEFPFEGTWSATGTRQALPVGPGKRAVIFYLSGSMILTAHEGLSRGFRNEAIGYGTESGLKASCVWTDDEGDQIFSELEGPGLGSGSHVVGTVTGGTGRYAGATGHFEFDWQFVVDAPDGVVQGWAVGLRGTVCKPAPAAMKGSP